jgi:hypothetical protein
MNDEFRIENSTSKIDWKLVIGYCVIGHSGTGGFDDSIAYSIILQAQLLELPKVFDTMEMSRQGHAVERVLASSLISRLQRLAILPY